jgi:GT2 family glycosyltransferase
LALRIIDHEFRILYVPHIRLCHLMSAETRTADRPYYFYTRNYIWIAFKDYPPVAGAAFLASKLIMMLYFSIRSRRLRAYLRGLRDGFCGLSRIQQDRTRVRQATVGYIRALERWRPSLRARLSRHRGTVQI